MIDWNKIIYADCMDEKEGLPSLPDKSVDLCIADPPWNIGYTRMKGSTTDKTIAKRGDYFHYKKEHYVDKINNYEEFSLNWFNQISRICNKIIMTPGRQNLQMWYKITNPLDILIHTKKNGGYGGRLSRFNDIDFYLYYGKKVAKPYFRSNHFPYNNQPSGFLKRDPYLHTSPKNTKLWYHIISHINPKSVIDPFLGSGTTAEVCTRLGIPWLGYEINEVYSQDINKRLKNCKREPKQVTLFL